MLKLRCIIVGTGKLYHNVLILYVLLILFVSLCVCVTVKYMHKGRTLQVLTS